MFPMITAGWLHMDICDIWNYFDAYYGSILPFTTRCG